MSQDPLVATFEEIFSSSEDLLITLLVDGSGSVAHQFPILRQLCLELVEKMKGIDIQVIQFSTVARTECPFTRDFQMLSQSINSTLIFYIIFPSD